MEQIELRSVREPMVVRRPAMSDSYGEVLSVGAVTFVGVLASRFEPERRRIVTGRARAAQHALGERREIADLDRRLHSTSWQPVPFPAELTRVEHVALGVAEASQLELLLARQRALRSAIRSLGLRGAEGDQQASVPAVQSRDIAAEDVHFQIHEQHVSGAIVDLGLYLFHNAHALQRRAMGTYVLLPDVRDALEARWWRSLLEAAEHTLGLEHGAVQVSIGIDGHAAASGALETLYELRGRAIGFHRNPNLGASAREDVARAASSPVTEVSTRTRSAAPHSESACRLSMEEVVLHMLDEARAAQCLIVSADDALAASRCM